MIKALTVGASVALCAPANAKEMTVGAAFEVIIATLADLRVTAKNCRLPMDLAYVAKTSFLLAASDIPKADLRHIDRQVEIVHAVARSDRGTECRQGDAEGYMGLADRFDEELTQLEALIAKRSPD